MRIHSPPRAAGLLVAAVLAGVSALPANAQDGASRRAVAPGGAEVVGPYSPGIVHGDLVFASGALGTRADGTLPADVEGQVRQTFANLGRVLEAGGSSLERAARVTVFLTDSRHFATMDRVFREVFPDAPPVRATVENDLAIPGALVEIDVVAAREGAGRRVLPKPASRPDAAFSPVVEVGDTVFVAGMTSRDPETAAVVEGDVRVQTRRVLGNVAAALARVGLGLGDVVEATVFLSDTRDFGGMNEVWRSFFPGDPPCRATVRSRLMAPPFKVEIQVTAVRGDKTHVPAPGAPFSAAVVTDDRVYLSGFVGRGPDGYPLGDVRAQTRTTLARIRDVLSRTGHAEFGDVLTARVFLVDVRNFAAMNEVYADALPSPRPARTTVGAQLMSPDALVEIQMVAARRPAGR